MPSPLGNKNNIKQWGILIALEQQEVDLEAKSQPSGGYRLASKVLRPLNLTDTAKIGKEETSIFHLVTIINFSSHSMSKFQASNKVLIL